MSLFLLLLHFLPPDRRSPVFDFRSLRVASSALPWPARLQLAGRREDSRPMGSVGLQEPALNQQHDQSDTL